MLTLTHELHDKLLEKREMVNGTDSLGSLYVCVFLGLMAWGGRSLDGRPLACEQDVCVYPLAEEENVSIS